MHFTDLNDRENGKLTPPERRVMATWRRYLTLGAPKPESNPVADQQGNGYFEGVPDLPDKVRQRQAELRRRWCQARRIEAAVERKGLTGERRGRNLLCALAKLRAS